MPLPVTPVMLSVASTKPGKDAGSGNIEIRYWRD
jgi:hypothetical protein